MDPQSLKKQLEELIFYQLEQDLIEFPFNKREFSPYVVVALSKGLRKDEVAQDILKQLDAEMEHVRLFARVAVVSDKKPTLKERVCAWLKSLF
ncbi:hypothetical protein ACES2J_08300 [Bdellovibrio bacteriovorus]|uniref:hypothetical protein n=1 Tax=Bdellovibrio bacteriovorus TaxID=959 RepID=UPI0035A743DB